ncbi:MAG: SIS domain-containing protein [Lentisphaeraceae bacterium]|nr:SIS domain-containing protein [Lentisphaeraceae bacterium]
MDSYNFVEEFKKYYGEEPGGANLKLSLENLPLNSLQIFFDSISKMDQSGRIFFLGNGGSFDNARTKAAMARSCNFESRIPWHEDDYESIIQESTYAEVFSESLKKEKLCANDIVIGISGSGNSVNVLKALSYAVAVGAETFALGGRDGVVMSTVVEKDHCILAASECMEIIEETNNLMILAVFKSLKEEVSLTSSVLNLLKQFQDFLNGNNFEKLGEIASGIVDAYKKKGRIFLLGTGIGVNHFKSDLKRGATDQVPISGLEVPELFSMNSYMATANDDGPDFTFAAGLMNHRPNENDFALLFNDEYSDKRAGLCREILEKCKVPFVSVDEGGLDITCFDKDSQSFAITMLGHSCSVVLNRYFKKSFKIRQLETKPGFPEGQKKLGIQDTVQLEDKYRAAGLITANEVLSFSYGKVFAVSSSEPFERNFF